MRNLRDEIVKYIGVLEKDRDRLHDYKPVTLRNIVDYNDAMIIQDIIDDLTKIIQKEVR